MVEDKTKEKDSREQYINLIELILYNLTDIEGIKRIYEFAQKIWFHEEK